MTDRPRMAEFTAPRASRCPGFRTLGAICAAVGLSAALVGCIDFGDPQPNTPDGDENAILGGAGAGGGGGGTGATSGSDETIVTIANLAFSPNEVTIEAGGTVRWVMEDVGFFHFLVEGAPDSPANYEPLFDTPRLDPGEDFAYTFKRPGEYTYYCSNHAATMSDAKVTVE